MFGSLVGGVWHNMGSRGGYVFSSPVVGVGQNRGGRGGYMYAVEDGGER